LVAASERKAASSSRLVHPVEIELIGDCGLLEHSSELGLEIVHVVAQLHNRGDSLNLVMHPLFSKFLEPLVVILFEMRVWFFLRSSLPTSA
jgi:hypothetical protein